MATGDDMNTMVALAEAEIDKFLGGHDDDALAALFTSSGYLWNIMNGTVSHKTIIAFLGQLINKVYDLENP